MAAFSRLLSIALLSPLIVAACATPASLRTTEETHRRQPVVTEGGPVSEAASDRLIADVAGADSGREKAQLKVLSDHIRASLSQPLVAGNRATVLVDGPATFVAIDKAIAQARHHVHVETYIFADDDFGRKFSKQLIEKRKQGVEVRVIYDAVGSIESSQKFFDELKDAGVEVIEFHPINPMKTFLWKMQNRDHRKLIVVDGHVAFTGGLNISNAYSSGSSSKPGPEAGLKEAWRDTHVQLDGPVVEQFQKLFLDTWAKLGGKLARPDAAYYPELKSMGENLASAVASSGTKQQDESIYRTYMAAIENASKRIWITQAYLMPPEEMSEALVRAVKRGVDVRIIVPSFSDSKLVLSASHHEYDPLLEGGVRLIEAQDALLHAKTALVDDSLSIIGSANLDYRSFLHNNEVNAVIIGEEAAQKMESVFKRDLANGKELTLKEWRERGLWQKTRENVSRLLKFWL